MLYLLDKIEVYMSLVIKKPDFCICENKDADQLRGNREADQRLCFRYIDPSTLLIRNYKPLAIFCSCTARYLSDLVVNPDDRFSQNEAHIGHFRNAFVRSKREN